MGPVAFSTPEQVWLDRPPAQVSTLPYSTRSGLASAPWEKSPPARQLDQQKQP